MEQLVQQLPELTLLIVEHLINGNDDNNCVDNYDVKENKGVLSAASFARSCKGAEVLVEYLFRKKCSDVINPSFRGWKDIENASYLSWTKLYLDATKIKEKLLLAWSFHTYTPDVCEKVYDNSINKCHGTRTFTEITDGQFGKAMRLPHPVDGSLHQMKGSQVQGMLTSLPSPVSEFTLATWINIKKCDTSSLISLLFTPKPVTNQKTMMQGLSFVILNISANGNLFFGRTHDVSSQALQSDIWHHLVITGTAQELRVYVDNKNGEGERYVEILNVKQACCVPTMEKMVVMIGNGKKGEYIIEETCVVGKRLEKDNFWWLRNGLPFV